VASGLGFVLDFWGLPLGVFEFDFGFGFAFALLKAKS